MTLEEAIEVNQQRLIRTNEALRQKMSEYHLGIINKEQWGTEQTAINKIILSIKLGIEALERLRDLRSQGIILRDGRLPSEEKRDHV